MRSEKIIPLFKKISSLKGIGPKLENAFVNLFGDSKIIYFFWNIPKDFSKRNLIKKITLDDLGKNVILKIKINKHNIFFKNKIFRINCHSNNVDFFPKLRFRKEFINIRVKLDRNTANLFINMCCQLWRLHF